MHRFIVGALASLFLILSLSAEEPRTVVIHLTDDTQVKGQILGMAEGTYQVKTDTLGTLSIKAQSIDRIDYNPGKTAATTHQPKAPAAALDQSDRLNALFGFEEILQTVMADPETMKNIQKLSEDPEFVAVLDDPEIKKAIESGNFAALARNKKIRGLMDHPSVKAITEQVKEGDKQSEE